jgi:quinol monooxygenase YgiN
MTETQPEGVTMSVGVLVKLQAQPGAEEALAEFVTSALPIVMEEPGTIQWIAYRTTHDTFWIVDTNPDEEARERHLSGAVPQALMAQADQLLLAEPEFHMASVLATKHA